MALNTPLIQNFEIEEIIATNLTELTIKLKLEGFDVAVQDLSYQFFERTENLYIFSLKLFPVEVLPSKFGVYRGYSGGGIHSGLAVTDICRMNNNTKAQALRLLSYFQKAFWKILQEIDTAYEQTVSEDLPVWESVQL